MNTNPVVWSQTQDLLLKLLQALKPLADPSSEPSVLMQRFFVPPKVERFYPFHHAVQILSTLQKQVEEFIGPGASSEESTPTQKQPLPKQAQRLITQVQEAISKLCSSTHFKNPDEAPLRQSLKTLKPGLDRIIQAVTHEGMHNADDGLPPPFRFPLPRTARQELIQKLISFPEMKARSKPKEGERGGETSVQHPSAKPQTISIKTLTTLLKPESKPQLTPTERTTIPAAPFTPEARSTPPRPKKKRKGFWFRDQKEEEQRDNP